MSIYVREFPRKGNIIPALFGDEESSYEDINETMKTVNTILHESKYQIINVESIFKIEYSLQTVIGFRVFYKERIV